MKCDKCGVDKEEMIKLLDQLMKEAGERIDHLDKLMDEKIQLLKSI